MLTVGMNSYVHGWDLASASGVRVRINDSKSTKIPDYNIANFDVLKLPVLEVCFYTPRSGCVTSVLVQTLT